MLWSSSTNADAYVIAYDAVGGRRQIEVAATNTTDGAVVTDLQTDVPQSIISVAAKNTGGTSAPKSIEFHIPDLRDLVEALFLGSGPYAEPGEAYCCVPDRMNGWTPGNVRLRVHSSLASYSDYFTRFADQLSALTSGYLQGQVVEIGDVRNEAVFVQDELKAFSSQGPCPSGSGGCVVLRVLPGNPAYLKNPANLFVVPDRSDPGFVIPHELGHALLGLHHVNPNGRWYPQVLRPNIAVGPQVSPDWGYAPGQVLSELEKDAVRRVYATGLRPGSTRGDFVASGLIR